MASIAHQISRCLAEITLSKAEIDEMKSELQVVSLKKALRPHGNPTKPLPYILGIKTADSYFRAARTFFSSVKEDTGKNLLGEMLNYETILSTFDLHYADAAPGTAYKIQAAIKKVHAGAVKLGWAHGKCPIDNDLHDRVKNKARTPRYGYHPEDANLILSYLERKNSVYALPIRLIYFSALRENEAAGLMGVNIDRTRRLLCFRGKNNRYREVPISSSLLAKLPAIKGFLFTPSEAWCGNLRKGVARVCKELEIGMTGIHRFRATRAQIWYTAFRSNGLDEREARKKVSVLLGHNRINITFHYIPKYFDWLSFVPYLDLEDEDIF